MERGRMGGMVEDDRPVHHHPRQPRGAGMTDHEADLVPTVVEANGNDPISPLSVAAEPALCLSK
jgi:hypothetical protein